MPETKPPVYLAEKILTVILLTLLIPAAGGPQWHGAILVRGWRSE